METIKLSSEHTNVSYILLYESICEKLLEILNIHTSKAIDQLKNSYFSLAENDKQQIEEKNKRLIRDCLSHEVSIIKFILGYQGVDNGLFFEKKVFQIQKLLSSVIRDQDKKIISIYGFDIGKIINSLVSLLNKYEDKSHDSIDLSKALNCFGLLKNYDYLLTENQEKEIITMKSLKKIIHIVCAEYIVKYFSKRKHAKDAFIILNNRNKEFCAPLGKLSSSSKHWISSASDLPHKIKEEIKNDEIYEIIIKFYENYLSQFNSTITLETFAINLGILFNEEDNIKVLIDLILDYFSQRWQQEIKLELESRKITQDIKNTIEEDNSNNEQKECEISKENHISHNPNILGENQKIFLEEAAKITQRIWGNYNTAFMNYMHRMLGKNNPLRLEHRFSIKGLQFNEELVYHISQLAQLYGVSMETKATISDNTKNIEENEGQQTQKEIVKDKKSSGGQQGAIENEDKSTQLVNEKIETFEPALQYMMSFLKEWSEEDKKKVMPLIQRKFEILTHRAKKRFYDSVNLTKQGGKGILLKENKANNKKYYRIDIGNGYRFALSEEPRSWYIGNHDDYKIWLNKK